LASGREFDNKQTSLPQPRPGFDYMTFIHNTRCQICIKKRIYPRHALSCARPNFRAAKKRKMPRTCGKPYGNACYAGYVYCYLHALWSNGCQGRVQIAGASLNAKLWQENFTPEQSTTKPLDKKISARNANGFRIITKA